MLKKPLLILGACIASFNQFAQTYCAKSSTNPGIGYISNVKLSGMNNSSTYASGGYSDYTSLSTLQICTSKNYPLIVTNTRSNTSTFYNYGVWIDLNKDGDFTDAGELVYSLNQSNASSFTFNLNLGTPYNNLGNTRMRIVMMPNSIYSSCNDPNPMTAGEVEDYKLNIGNLSAGVSAPIITGATEVCNSTVTTNPLTYNLFNTYANMIYFWTLTGAGGSATLVHPNGSTTGVSNQVHLYGFNNQGTNYTGTFNINVTATDACGVSYLSTLPVSVETFPSTVASPTIPAGPINVLSSDITTYTTNDGTFRKQWEIQPTNAGVITNVNNTSASVDWNNSYSGVAQIRVRNISSCANGPWSTYQNVNVASASTCVDQNEIYTNNNTLASATAIATNTLVSGSITASGDYDNYKFTTVSGATNIKVDFSAAVDGFIVSLKNSAGTVLVSNSAYSASQTLKYNTSATGTYYVTVSGYYYKTDNNCHNVKANTSSTPYARIAEEEAQATTEALRLYPNPIAEGETLTIASAIAPENQLVQVNVINTDGTVVKRQSIQFINGNAGLSISDLKKGLYIVDINGVGKQRFSITE